MDRRDIYSLLVVERRWEATLGKASIVKGTFELGFKG